MSDIHNEPKVIKRTFKQKLISFLKETKIKFKQFVLSIKVCFKKEIINE